MAGNRLGRKAKYVYVSDNGTSYGIKVDVDLATAAGLEEATTGLPSPPKGLELRGVHVQRAISIAAPTGGVPTAYVARKFLPCNRDEAIYASDAPATVTIDEEVFISTGRKGESRRYI